MNNVDKLLKQHDKIKVDLIKQLNEKERIKLLPKHTDAFDYLFTSSIVPQYCRTNDLTAFIQ